MAVFGRRSKGDDIRERAIDPDELRRSVDEGFLIAKSAVTIAVANRIIRNALQQHETFDAEAVARATRDELLRMAAEQEAGAERMRELRSVAQNAKGRSKHQHDYRRGDDLKLRTREATYVELAAAMTAGAADHSFVDGIVITARERAWDDIGTTVVGRLGWAQRPADDYEDGRDDRVRQLLDEDFAALVAEHPVAAAGGSSTSETDTDTDTDSDASETEIETDADSDASDADADTDGRS